MSSPFQRAFDEAAGLPVDFCAACGGPGARAPLVVVLEEGQALGECQACGGLVDPPGRSLRRPEGGLLKVIHLMDDEDEDDELAA